MSYYDKGEYKYPSVTTIISDCTNISFGLKKWSATEVVRWIRENCIIPPHGHYMNGDDYCVSNEDLDQAEKAYEITGQTALDVGKEVHDWIEKYLSSKEYPHIEYEFYYGQSSEQAHTAVVAFCDWAEKHDLKPIALEQTVYSESGCWAGTCDFLGYFDNRLYIIDWKSSKPPIRPEMRYQVAAYRWAEAQKIYSTISPETEFFWNVPVGCGVLRLDKETGLPEWKDTSKTYEKDLKVFHRMVDLYFERHPKIAKGAGWKNI